MANAEEIFAFGVVVPMVALGTTTLLPDRKARGAVKALVALWYAGLLTALAMNWLCTGPPGQYRACAQVDPGLASRFALNAVLVLPLTAGLFVLVLAVQIVVVLWRRWR